MAQVQYPPGTAPIKAEYIISLSQVRAVDDDAAEGGTGATNRRDQPQPQADGRPGPTTTTDETGPKRSGRLTKEQKKAQRGANKGRRFGKVKDDFDLCWKVANGAACEFGSECRFSHDIGEYLAAKPADLHIPPQNLISISPPYAPEMETLRKPHDKYPNIDTSTSCPVLNETGECRYGFKCRFLGAHVHESSEEERAQSGLPLVLTRDSEKQAHAALTAHEINFVGVDVQRRLQSKKYQTPVADAYLLEIGEQPFNQKRAQKNGRNNRGGKTSSVVVGEDGTVIVGEPEQEPDFGGAEENKDSAPMDVDEKPQDDSPDALIQKRTGDVLVSDAQKDNPDVRIRASEKKRHHWTGKTYLAPLTTVGNLPFRRICVDFGADITCGEMGLANSFLSGSKEEWSLVRRHPSEKIFGVQVAGNKTGNLVPTAEILAKELGSSGIDFVDLNCGCPIDLVFKSGSGSALLDTVGRLGKILVGMNRALGEIPLTVKLRTGVKDGKNTAHKTMPRLAAEWGAAALTLHGRTRQQRYTRLADWDYIKTCVEAVRAREKDEDLAPVPIFGGGDCFSSADYHEKVEQSGVDGIMIGRGALIKPWIFTEVKERREWDISATERLDIVRKYAEYGLNHFGSDTTGVNATRRYLCEALSFQYRYVPIGLLETLPGRINDRAPTFRGRSELGNVFDPTQASKCDMLTLECTFAPIYLTETLLASPDSQDWVKISEMFLGPAPEAWSFTPKHKSNAYGSEEGQG